MDLTASYQSVVPAPLLARFEWREVRNAAAIAMATNHEEWADIMTVLGEFDLTLAELMLPGGNKSELTGRLESAFKDRGWRESRLDTEITLTTQRRPYRAAGETKMQRETSSVTNQGYLVDGFKGRIALDVEWAECDCELNPPRVAAPDGCPDAVRFPERDNRRERDPAVRCRPRPRPPKQSSRDVGSARTVPGTAPASTPR